MKTVPLGSLFANRVATLDPREFPNEEFDLWSIPAYDVGTPDIAFGADIGSSKKCVEPNDVLLSRIIPHIRRSCVVTERRARRQIASGEWIVFRNTSFCPEYLRHFLLSDPFHLQFMQTVSGVGGSLLRARPDGVAKIRAPLPSLTEQRRIAAILDRAEVLRGKRRQGLQTVDLHHAIFVDMFGDPIQNNKDWPVTLLGRISNVERGKFTPRPRNDPTYYGGHYPFIQTGDINNSGGRVTSWSQTLNERGKNVSRSFPPGTVVIAIVGATLGATSILDVEVYCPDSVIGIQADGSLATPEYLEHLLRIWRPIFVAQAPDTARANMNLESLRPLKVPLPPIGLQRSFSRRVAMIEELRTSYSSAQAKLDALFASLQDRAFSGELASRDAERELALTG